MLSVNVCQGNGSLRHRGAPAGLAHPREHVHEACTLVPAAIRKQPRASGQEGHLQSCWQAEQLAEVRRAQNRGFHCLHDFAWRCSEALPGSCAAEAVERALVLNRRAAMRTGAQQQGACAAGARS